MNYIFDIFYINYFTCCDNEPNVLGIQNLNHVHCVKDMPVNYILSFAFLYPTVGVFASLNNARVLLIYHSTFEVNMGALLCDIDSFNERCMFIFVRCAASICSHSYTRAPV